jgi:DNA-binding transcriptional regulator YhcF (GntR family)
MAAKIQAGDNADLRTNEKKWSKPLMDAGWTALPSVIIENQRQLGLSPLDLNIVLYLASKWWTAEGRPYPSKSTMAKAMNVHPRTIQKHIAALEGADYIRREERRTSAGSKTNIYHLDGLIKAAQPFAVEKLAEMQDKAEMAKRRQNRRGAPKLRLVTPANNADDDLY